MRTDNGSCRHYTEAHLEISRARLGNHSFSLVLDTQTPPHNNNNPTTMSRHHPDLVMCRKQAGIAIGRLCDKCDGKCPVCDSYVRPTTLVRICDECSFGNYQNKCVVCGGEGISDAFYCFECTRLEKDRDGCPKIINLGSSRTDVCAPSLSLPFFFGQAYTDLLSTVVLPKENESDILAPS